MRTEPARDLVRALRAEPASWSSTDLTRRWSRNALRAAVRSGDVERILPDRYVAAEHAHSLAARAHAATASVGPRSVLVGLAAAAAYGLTEVDPDRIVVTGPRGARAPAAAWVRVWRSDRSIPAANRGGLRTALPADAVVTAFDDLLGTRAPSAVFQAVQQRLTTPHELREASSRWRPVKRRAELLQAITDAEAGCESVLEAFGLRHVFTGGDFAHWVRQHRLMLDGVSVRLDMYDPETRTAVELDSETHHSGEAARARDVRRDALLASHGIMTVRFTSRDLRLHPGWCRETVIRVATSRRGKWAA